MLSIINIYNVSENGWKSYKDYLDVLLYFERIIEQNIHNRHYYCHGVVNQRTKDDFIQKQMDYLVPLIKSHVTQSKEPYVPQYIYDIFVHFCESKTDYIDLSCIHGERQFMCRALRMIFFSGKETDRRLNKDRIKDMFPKLQSYRDEHNLLVQIKRTTVKGAKKWYDDIERSNANIVEDGGQIEMQLAENTTRLGQIATETDSDITDDDEDDRKYPDESPANQKKDWKLLDKDSQLSVREKQTTTSSDIDTSVYSNFTYIDSAAERVTSLTTTVVKSDELQSDEDERKYPEETDDMKEYPESLPEPEAEEEYPAAEDEEESKEKYPASEEEYRAVETVHSKKMKGPRFQRIPKPDPGECWADQYPDKKDPRGEPDEIAFKWDKNNKDKKHCDTIHMLYLLQCACELHRRRVIERNKYFTSISRPDRYIDHVDGPQIITNILKWHNKDKDNNVLLGEWLTSKPELFWINDIFSDIGMIIRIVLFLSGFTSTFCCSNRRCQEGSGDANLLEIEEGGDD